MNTETDQQRSGLSPPLLTIKEEKPNGVGLSYGHYNRKEILVDQDWEKIGAKYQVGFPSRKSRLEAAWKIFRRREITFEYSMLIKGTVLMDDMTLTMFGDVIARQVSASRYEQENKELIDRDLFTD